MPINYIPHPITANIRDETATRALGGGPYTNNSLRPIMVIISMIHVTTAPAQFNLAQMNVNAAAVNFCGYFVSLAAGQTYGNIQALVPPGGTYQVTTNITPPGVITLIRWIEVDL